MKKILLSFMLLLLAGTLCAPAQSRATREVTMPTEKGLGVNTEDYTTLEKGFFFSGEAVGGYSVSHKPGHLGFGEVDAVGGYRFSEYLRAGIGLGFRYYFKDGDVRNCSHHMGMPLFLNLRGNFIPSGYRNVVPYWSVDLGGTFPDGVMVRPSVGIRVGEPRNAFTVSVGYMGQDIRTARRAAAAPTGATRTFFSFVDLKVGYEF